MAEYKDYYNATRTHLSLDKDAPVPRCVERAGNIVCRPILGDLHHKYGRMRGEKFLADDEAARSCSPVELEAVHVGRLVLIRS